MDEHWSWFHLVGHPLATLPQDTSMSEKIIGMSLFDKMKIL
jgi:hypothetical protein